MREGMGQLGQRRLTATKSMTSWLWSCFTLSPDSLQFKGLRQPETAKQLCWYEPWEPLSVPSY